jgi:unsaturated rhamnogalacturonyl hydrolase
MLNIKVKRQIILILIVCLSFASGEVMSQVVALDNWYNREINAATGKPFHYLWTDSAFSGYSEWGKIFRRKGALLTTIGRPTSENLGKSDIYIIVDPDTTSENKSPNYILTEDIPIIVEWVRRGGVLALLGNDAPNCEFTHFNNLASEFGMHFNHVTLHRVAGTDFEAGTSTNLPSHPLFRDVSKIFMKDVSDITLSGTASAILTEKGKVLIAENVFGKGYVFAIGDPWIYNEYIDHAVLPESFDNLKAAQNLTDLLLSFTIMR